MRAVYRGRAGRSSRSALAALLIAAAPVRAEPIVPYTVTDGARIESSLTGRAGDPRAGAALVWHDAARTRCVLCHGAPGLSAPALSAPGVVREPAVLRLWLVAPGVIDPALAFHSAYAPGQRLGADDPLHGGPRLTADEIEDLVAWLAAGAPLPDAGE